MNNENKEFYRKMTDPAVEEAAIWEARARKAEQEITVLTRHVNRLLVKNADLAESRAEAETWCENCGEDVPLDEDLCCRSCGAEAMVEIERVRALTAERDALAAKLERIREAAKVEKRADGFVEAAVYSAWTRVVEELMSK